MPFKIKKPNGKLKMNTLTHTHTHIYIYIYIYILCMFECVYIMNENILDINI